MTENQRPTGVRNPRWSRDEIILALDLYNHRDYPHGSITKSHPAVQELSGTLGALAELAQMPDPEKFRNRNGVYMKVMNLRQFDRYYTDRGLTGLSGASKLDGEIYEEFDGELAHLRSEAARIRRHARPEGEQPTRPGIESRTVLLERPYIEVREDVTLTPSEATPLQADLSALERSTGEHNALQNRLWRFLTERGIEGKTRTAIVEPDLAWDHGGASFLAEVKSLNDRSETQQLRLGVGQLLHYREVFEELGRSPELVLVIPRRPREAVWERLCDRVGIWLVWPEVFPYLV